MFGRVEMSGDGSERGPTPGGVWDDHHDGGPLGLGVGSGPIGPGLERAPPPWAACWEIGFRDLSEITGLPTAAVGTPRRGLVGIDVVDELGRCSFQFSSSSAVASARVFVPDRDALSG